MTPPPLDYRRPGPPPPRAPVDVERALIRLGLFAAAFFVGVALLWITGYVYNRNAYLTRYDPAVLVGMTEAQAIARLGPPHSRTESYLAYQRGMDPDAVLDLAGGKVVRVEQLKYRER